jgi:serine/threonine protein kinase
MSDILEIKGESGTLYKYYDEIIGAGGMKDVYFTTDKQYAIGFYRDKSDAVMKERLKMLTGRYRDRIYNQQGGEYWNDLFCWPEDIVTNGDGFLGVVVPVYHSHFFFEYGSFNNDILKIKGKEKEGKWYSSPTNRYRFLNKKERGDWLSYLRISILIARSVKRLHAAGLAHSDLSYKNVLVDPVGGNACIIDIDGLVVPGKFPPDVIGTPDFIAPEVITTQHLSMDDKGRKLPSIHTDRYALAVLIYMYLLLRHPLKGNKVHDVNNSDEDEKLSMGSKAIFVEHEQDLSNRPDLNDIKDEEIRWLDTNKLSYKTTGPYLSKLIKRAFEDGLHDPGKRPSADEWETALVKTVDLIQPCQNSSCDQKWFVFDNTTVPCCPFCGTDYSAQLPVLNLYSSRKAGSFKPDNHRLMVYSGQSLYPWHVNRLVFPNERMSTTQKKRVGYFLYHNDKWLLVNENMSDLTEVSSKKAIAIGESVELKDGAQILFSKENGGRLAQVQLVGE